MLFSVLARPFRASLSILVTVSPAAGWLLVASGAAHSRAQERSESKNRRALDVARDRKGDALRLRRGRPNSFDSRTRAVLLRRAPASPVPRNIGRPGPVLRPPAHKRNIRPAT
jgi:hypothetical protein